MYLENNEYMQSKLFDEDDSVIALFNLEKNHNEKTLYNF